MNHRMGCLALTLLWSALSLFAQEVHDRVKGNLIQFNDNGAWCWFQDERAIIDAAQQVLVAGSVASASGSGGAGRMAAVEATIYDLESGMVQNSRLYKAGYTDDHNAPGLLLRPDGRYLAVYAEHYDRYNSRYQIFDGAGWSGEKCFDWTTIPGGTDYTIAYSNLCYLAAEHRTYCFARANHRAPNFIYSDDQGDTWHFGGQLTTNTSNTYNKGYYKYWSDGVSRIDFIFTEQHPRDTLTSIYHGFIQGGKSYASDGTLVDDDIYDAAWMPTFRQFTRVFANGTAMNGVVMQRCWNAELVRYADGTLAALITARTDHYSGRDAAIDPGHAFIYCRYDGQSWHSTYLGKAGSKMYSSEADYTGLGALCPDDPHTLYLSTAIDPRDDAGLTCREIFKGVTGDEGASWSWSPVTWNSVRDNFRPIVPAWDSTHTALLWWRGTYSSAQDYDAAVVGLIESKQAEQTRKTFVDATLLNTLTAGGATVGHTGPAAGQGAADGLWHLRTGYGNGPFLFTSAEAGGENSPALKTTFVPGAAGIYDIWINFWGNPAADWRIKAGLEGRDLRLFRSMACRQVEAGEHDLSLTLSGGESLALYEAYLGRVLVAAGGAVTVCVDDEAIAAGKSTLSGDRVRTWYDGVSFARTGALTEVADKAERPARFRLQQNYPNPFNAATTIPITLDRGGEVTLRIFNLAGQCVDTLLCQRLEAGEHRILWQASAFPSGIYICRLESGPAWKMMRLTLLK